MLLQNETTQNNLRLFALELINVSSITEYLLPLTLTASSKRNPTAWSNTPKSEMRKEWVVFPSVQLKTVLPSIYSHPKCYTQEK